MYWALSEATMRKFYIGAEQPLIHYASLAWVGIAPGQLRKLSKLQLRAALMITGGMFSTSYAALEVESDLLPFSLHFRRGAKLETFQLRQINRINQVSRWLVLRTDQRLLTHISLVHQAFVWWLPVNWTRMMSGTTVSLGNWRSERNGDSDKLWQNDRTYRWLRGEYFYRRFQVGQ